MAKLKPASKKFKSQYHKTVEDLIALKTAMEEAMSTRRANQKIIREFSNGLAIMDDQTAMDKGITEVTNYLTTYRILRERASRFFQSYTNTREFIRIVVDTNNPEQDSLNSDYITEALNEKVLYHRSGTFRAFVKAMAGEIEIGGGAPVNYSPKGGWAPQLAINMLLPKGCGITPGSVPYNMVPVDLTLQELMDLKAVKGGSSTSTEALDVLIENLKQKPKGEAFTYSKGKSKVGSVINTEDFNRNASVEAWWYYEVKTDDTSGEQHVSGTFFTDSLTFGSDTMEPTVIAYFEKAFETPEQWMHLFCMDMEIGGDVTWDKVRGIAEIMYPSAAKMEELLNLIMQGDMERALTRFVIGDGAIYDDVLGWDPAEGRIAPKGVNVMDMKGSSAPLLGNMQVLQGNAANLGNSGVQNNRQGGELRQQSIERQGINTQMQYGDMAEWTCNFECICVTMVERIMVGKMNHRTPGYKEVMRFRQCMKDYGIDLEALCKKEYGEFKFIQVRVNKVLGDGGVESEKTASDFLMQIYTKLHPGKRPLILRNAIAYYTKDPDLAANLVEIPQPIINAQKLTAENECDTIFRRAPLGQVMPTMPGDVPQDHIPIHMLDMIAKVARHQARPWDKLDVLEFAALQRHTQDHIEQLLEDNDTRDEGQQYLPQFTQIVNAAQVIATQVEEREAQAQEQMSPEAQAKIQLALMAEQRKATELGMKQEGQVSLERQRIARAAQVSDMNYLRKLESAARYSLDQQRLALQQRQQAVNERQQQFQNILDVSDQRHQQQQDNKPEPAAAA